MKALTLLRLTLLRKAAAFAAPLGLAVLTATCASAQIVINEIVKEERTAGSGAVDPDVREFIELYNAGTEPVNLTGWTLGVYDIAVGAIGVTDTIPSGTIAPGDYFVIGGEAVPNVDFSPVPNNLYADGVAHIIELRKPSAQPNGDLVDAIGYEVYRSGLTNATTEQLAQIGTGYRSQLISMNAVAPNSIISWSRYRDGVDTNRNGYDFGILPATPGATNALPQVAMHGVPDVDALAPGAELSDDYYASFVLPRVVNPTVVSGANPRAIPASPQGGNAIVAWDETGGGNAVYSRELINSFDIYAYIDTTPLGIGVTTQTEEWETSSFGIGSTDAFYTNPDPSGGIFTETSVLQNGSTGIGWVYQQYENPAEPTADFSRMMLVDFGQGGDSNGVGPNLAWTVIETIDVSAMAADWYRLAINYDPTTGDVVARFGEEVYEFTTETDLAGNFFVGYREAITAQGSRLALLNPPIFDIYEEAGSVVGDYDGNGSVGPEDYAVWAGAYGSNVTAGSGADGNGDGVIDAADYTVWRDASGSAISSAVPEPTTLAAAVMGLVGALGWRRR